jgi:predicted P-loop ATPase
MRFGELIEVFDALEEALTELSIDYYLIGAVARKFWPKSVCIDFTGSISS